MGAPRYNDPRTPVKTGIIGTNGVYINYGQGVAVLTADNVVVTDDQGHVLAGAANSIDTAAAQAKDLVEQQTRTKIETLLDAALG